MSSPEASSLLVEDDDQTWLYDPTDSEVVVDIESCLERHKRRAEVARDDDYVALQRDLFRFLDGCVDTRTYARPARQKRLDRNLTRTIAHHHDDDAPSPSPSTSKPIDIDLSAPANNFSFSASRFLGSSHGPSDSFANISPPSLVSSIAMDESDAFASLDLSRQGSVSAKRGAFAESSRPQNSLCSSMSTSILDEREMNTSFLSQGDAAFPSFDSSTIRKEIDGDMITSATFDDMVDSTDDERPFHYRRSFLNEDERDRDAINAYLKRNSKCNTDDLQDLAADLLQATVRDRPPMDDDDDSDFLLSEGMSESFVKQHGGRESLNLTFSRKFDPQETTLLPNQAVSHHPNMLTYRKSPKQTPRRNETFRKSSPPGQNCWNMVDISVEDAKTSETYNDVDSNKQNYATSLGDQENVRKLPVRHERDDRKLAMEGKSMAGSSSDSLEGSSSSDRTPPQPTTVPLCLDDLEYLAYQQHQSLFRDVSTPVPNNNNNNNDNGKSKRSIFQQQGDLSPIKGASRDALSPSQKYATYRVTSSSTGNLTRTTMGFPEGYRSPYRAPPPSQVKRESSAPEFAAAPLRSPQRLLAKKEYGASGGSIPARSVGSSPSRTLYNSRMQNQSLNNTLTKYKQNSGSTTELRTAKSGLPASKLRQYSSHKELNKLPGPARWSVANGLRPSSRTGFHSSNPVLHPAPLTRQGSYTIAVNDQPSMNTMVIDRKSSINREVIDRTVPSKLTNAQINNGQPLRANHGVSNFTGATRDVAFNNPRGDTQSNPKVPSSQQIPSSNSSVRPPNPTGLPGPATASQRLPRPSGLPRPASGIPRKPALRPPSTYSLAPRPNDQTDCY